MIFKYYDIIIKYFIKIKSKIKNQLQIIKYWASIFFNI